MTSRTELTSRQRKILSVIRDAVEANGYPPSIREIGLAVQLTSTSSVHSQLAQLEKKGYIRRDPTKPRAIEVFGLRAGDEQRVSPPRKLTADVPLVGQIAAGTPILAEENIEDQMPLPRDLVGQGELFMLTVRGDSMIDAGVLDGDRVVVRKQPNAELGEMVAVRIDDEATVKFLSSRDGRLRLLPANANYEPIELEGTNASIEGKVVTVLRSLA